MKTNRIQNIAMGLALVAGTTAMTSCSRDFLTQTHCQCMSQARLFLQSLVFRQHLPWLIAIFATIILIIIVRTFRFQLRRNI